MEKDEEIAMRVKGKEIGSGRPCICVPVMEEKKEQVIKEIIAVAESAADMIEWRVDAFESFRDNNTMREIFEAVAPYLKEKIFLYTFRSAKQGGLAEITEDELIDLEKRFSTLSKVNPEREAFLQEVVVNGFSHAVRNRKKKQ